MAGPGQCCSLVTMSTAWQLTSCRGSKMTSSLDFCVIYVSGHIASLSFISDSELSFSLIFAVLCEGNILMVLIWYLKYEKYFIGKLVSFTSYIESSGEYKCRISAPFRHQAVRNNGFIFCYNLLCHCERWMLGGFCLSNFSHTSATPSLALNTQGLPRSHSTHRGIFTFLWILFDTLKICPSSCGFWIVISSVLYLSSHHTSTSHSSSELIWAAQPV